MSDHSSLRDFCEGDRVILDNTVPGTVDGWYGSSVVFRPDWKPGLTIWGTLKPHSISEYEGEHLSTRTKHVSLSRLLVHPSSLKREPSNA
jgi:hypothetical protein